MGNETRTRTKPGFVNVVNFDDFPSAAVTAVIPSLDPHHGKELAVAASVEKTLVEVTITADTRIRGAVGRSQRYARFYVTVDDGDPVLLGDTDLGGSVPLEPYGGIPVSAGQVVKLLAMNLSTQGTSDLEGVLYIEVPVGP